ncbi:methyltransferase domain-containing protein [Nitrospira sp. T9]|uniref:methyltransferase domain-containing protein n=1 Tax=unclassified Nitrospira TaxID=2652172 RepID=UPI003F9A9593
MFTVMGTIGKKSVQESLLNGHGKLRKFGATTSLRQRTGEQRKLLSEFSSVDGADDPQSLIWFLDQTTGNPQYWANQQALIQMFSPKKGARLLDVGCGIGHDAFALGETVGEKGQGIWIDASRHQLNEARKRAKELPINVESGLGDAQQLEFPDRTFDGCWASRVLMHLPNPRKAAREMFRVLKSRGTILSLEADWDTLVITTGSARRSTMLRRLLQNGIRHPGMGHALPVIFKEAGFEGIAVGAGTYVFSDLALANLAWRIGPTVALAVKAGKLSGRKAETLMQELAKDNTAGKFFGAATGFYIMGTRP